MACVHLQEREMVQPILLRGVCLLTLESAKEN